MSRLFLDTNFKTAQKDDFRATLETIFQQIEDGINDSTDVVSLVNSTDKLPVGIRSGDLVVKLADGELQVGLYNGANVVYASFGSFTGAITNAQHGTRAGGNLHSDATSSVAGFMSAADKVKSDRYKGDTSAAGPASLTEYPANGDWGFHEDTVGVTYKLAKNKSGTIYTVLLT